MTSDRGNTEGAELQLTTPVTPKTAGLNPNATVFLSSKTSNVTTDTEWDNFEVNDYAYANGDMGKTDQGGEGGFTPSDSPLPADVQSLNDNQNVYSGENATSSEAEEPLANEIVSEDHLRQVLKRLLEICFSRETLASDSYLQSQMDSDQYLPIATVANLQQIQELTSNTELITELLRESQNFQVDEKGEKVRPNHNRCIVILREIPDTTPVEDVKELFSGENCPKFVSCEFAHNDNWYVTFDSDADAQQAYQYLRENVKTFLGKPIMARIKAKPLIKMTYPRNGYVKRYQQQQAAQQQAQQQPQQQQQQQQTTEQPQQQFPIQQVPLMPNVGPYINGQQIPFFTSSPAILPQWPTSPTLLDPSMVLAMNGYQATSVKINPPQSRPPFSNVNRNNRNQKQHRPNNQDRMNVENRLGHDRPLNDRPRTSPRNSDSSQISSHHSYQGQSRRGENSSSHSHIVHSSIQQSVDNGISNRQSDSLPPSQRRSYRSRRRRGDDDGARIPRQSISSSQSATKDNKSFKETQFDLEINSFPPLPGPGTSSSSSSTAGDIFDSKMSDVVKGTAKPQVREAKPQRVPSPVRVPSPPTPPASVVSSSTTMISPPLPQLQKEDGDSSSSLNGVSAVPSISGSNNSANVTTASTDTRVPTPPVSPPKTNKPSASNSDNKQKLIEPVTNRVVAVPTQAHVKVVDKPVMSVPVKLSYAQMVQRGRENEATAEINQSEESVTKGDNSNQSGSSSNRANQTLKEQSQTIKPSTANSRIPVKEQGRKDFEPKDQRLNSSRRSKENRERRDRRRDRAERDGSRSSNK